MLKIADNSLENNKNTSSTYIPKPWIEKYRPTKLNNIIGQPLVIELLKKSLKENKKPPHLLFYGQPGIGKTTTILSFCNEYYTKEEINDYVLEINASNDKGINTIKTIISQFLEVERTKKYKILILDEADALTQEAQTALRKKMEYAKNTLFCIICNNLNKIISALISRTKQFEFKPLSNDILKNHLKLIYNKEFNKNLLNEEEINDMTTNIVNLINGDLREGINMLQNLKYIITNNKTKNKKIIYGMKGLMPIDELKELINKFKTVKESSDIIKMYNEFIITNYSSKIIIKQIIDNKLVNDNIINKLVKLLDNEIDNDIIIYRLIYLISQ